MRSLISILALGGLSGCMIFFDGKGSGGDDTCALQEDTKEEPAIAPAPLRNPENLDCESFGGGCDERCGPCPAVAHTPPLPSWGICGHSCETLNATQCAANADCRVVRDARCAVAGDCLTDFIGCFPLDSAPDPSIDCFKAPSGWECSRDTGCSALHKQDPCPFSTDAVCPRQFALCVPEGKSPGKCHEPALCDAPEPPCPTGHKAGVAAGCFTGACIPLDVCEPM